MASTLLLQLQNLWPFCMLKSDDLRLSDRLVRKLSIPQHTKQFIFAVQEPESNSVVYILAAQNLSEQSALDAENLIKEVKPKAVIAQIAHSALTEIQAEEKSLRVDQENSIPTSSLGVLKKSLTDKIDTEQYDKLAGCQVLQEIFGVGLYGQLLHARRVTEDVGSCFLLLESPYESACPVQPTGTATAVEKNSGFNLQPNCLLPEKVTHSIYSTSHRFCLTDTLQAKMVKSLVPSLSLLLQETSSSHFIPESKPVESQLNCNNYKAPKPFAQSVYPLLVDLYDIFNDIPAIRRALVSAQKMLASINKGEPVDTKLLSDVYNFRIAIEGLRVALNNAAHCPINKMNNGNLVPRLEFSELPSNEKCHALFAHSLRSQAGKFGGPVVAIVDAGCLAGLRRHWRTKLPPEVAELADQCFTHHLSDNELDNMVDEDENEPQMSLWFVKDKPVVAVGAGATAVIGATSLSKAVPVSTLVKITTYKVPAVLKFGLANLKRKAYTGLAKILSPTVKLTASSQKIRAVTHSMIASAERTSLLAIRTSFYEIMRRRGVGSLRLAPWATFGCSLAACSGLVAYGDGIECAAESIPSVPAIASLGRGLQSLRQASQEVRQTSSSKMQEALHSLMYNLKRS